jgi:hypothetical protein
VFETDKPLTQPKSFSKFENEIWYVESLLNITQKAKVNFSGHFMGVITKANVKCSKNG